MPLISTMIIPPSYTTNELISRYIDGDSQAAELLIAKFSNYLDKWIRLLLHGYWNPKDKEIEHFLKMLGSVDPNTTLYIIVNRMKAYEKEDIEQEVKLVFLETVIRFKTIKKYFRYILQRRIRFLFRDPLVFNYLCTIPFEESIEIAAPNNQDINSAWVEGITCGRGFEDLSALERRVIQLNKWYGYSIETVATLLGISTSTVNRILAKTKVVLKVYYLE